jgi:hypothetical protein
MRYQDHDPDGIDQMMIDIASANVVVKGGYSIASFAKFAQAMVKLPLDDRLDKLTKFCKLCDDEKNSINGIIACQLLFEPERPLLGGPQWIGKYSNKVRIVEPIVFVNSTPVLAVRDYRVGGVQQSASEYLNRCKSVRVVVHDYECPSEKQISDDLNWYIEFIEIPEMYSENREFLISQGESKVRNE